MTPLVQGLIIALTLAGAAMLGLAAGFMWMVRRQRVRRQARTQELERIHRVGGGRGGRGDGNTDSLVQAPHGGWVARAGALHSSLSAEGGMGVSSAAPGHQAVMVFGGGGSGAGSGSRTAGNTTRRPAALHQQWVLPTPFSLLLMVLLCMAGMLLHGSSSNVLPMSTHAPQSLLSSSSSNSDDDDVRIHVQPTTYKLT